MPRPRVLTNEERIKRKRESRKEHERTRNDHNISLRIDNELLERLDLVAISQGLSRRQWLLKAIANELKSDNH